MRAIVHVKPLVPESEMDFDDAEDEPWGDHEYDGTFPDWMEDCPGNCAEQHVLDWFHDHVPISCLDHFEIDVEIIRDEKDFFVTVGRTSTRYATLQVRARDAKEAEDLAIKAAYDHDFNQHSEAEPVEYKAHEVKDSLGRVCPDRVPSSS